MTFVPSIHAYWKRAESAFAYAYKLLAGLTSQTVCVSQCRLLPELISDKRPALQGNGKGQARVTNLSLKKLQVGFV